MRKKIEEKKWRDILSDISENVTEVSYRSWFAPLVPMEIDEDAAVIYFATSKKQIMEVLEMRYIPVFERAVESVYHKKYKVVVKNKTESEIQQQLNAIGCAGGENAVADNQTADIVKMKAINIFVHGNCF